MLIADTLSRSTLKTAAVSEATWDNEELIFKVFQTYEAVNPKEFIPIKNETYRQIKSATENSNEMKKIKEIILNGWPVNKNETPLFVLQYFTFRGDLTMHEGIIFKGQQAVIPKEIRPDIMRKLHISHNGLKSTLR